MRVVLTCEPLLHQLTGIGYYCRALATRLHADPAIDLQLYASGTFQNPESLLFKSYQNSDTPTELQKKTLLNRIKSVAVNSEMVVSAYSRLIPKWEKWRLSHHSDALFHSTNYSFPYYEGPSCVTIHDLSTSCYPEYHPKLRADFINNEIKKVIDKKIPIITDSHFIKRQLISDFGVNASLISAIHLGSNEAFKPRAAIECDEVLSKYHLKYQSYFLTVATIEPRKNILAILRAYDQYCSRAVSPIPLVLIGSRGWHSEREHELIKSMATRTKLVYLGYVPRRELHKLYSAANSFIYPSFYEGFGLPVLEAASSGVPVLTSSQSSMSEILQGNGVEVEPNDVDTITQKIFELASDKEYRDHVGASCLAMASKFSWEKTYQSHLNLYSALVKR